MVLLFGSYARGDWVEDLAQGYFSDFDLMVVVENAALAEDDALWAKVASEAGRVSGRSPVTLLVHDIKEFFSYWFPCVPHPLAPAPQRRWLPRAAPRLQRANTSTPSAMKSAGGPPRALAGAAEQPRPASCSGAAGSS